MKREDARELLEKFAKEYWNPMLLPEIEPSDINDFLSTLPEEKEETYPREFVIWLFFDSKITYHSDLITDKNGKIYLNLFEVFKYWESKFNPSK